jgi:hypothetical protein
MLDVQRDQSALNRALRTAQRSLESLEGDAATPEQATKVLLNVVSQLVFLMERLIRESPPEQGDTDAVSPERIVRTLPAKE